MRLCVDASFYKQHILIDITVVMWFRTNLDFIRMLHPYCSLKRRNTHLSRKGNWQNDKFSTNTHQYFMYCTMRRGLRDPMKGSGKPQVSGQGYSPTSSTPTIPPKPGSLYTSQLKTHISSKGRGWEKGRERWAGWCPQYSFYHIIESCGGWQ